ncbi:FAD-binding oxidoreductase [Xenorhabdus nematophila]|uniref:NAD(P)/FAD-dependent oxidoreductase n=1 Tax=Xenorhabdus nematophila TaxID=628 RepID=UPI0005430A69|nr:FAD-dependent oxidoreductase [Xenorhabdus nematophila]CEF29291.1 FAD dependent oxidoreductase [Xenorhabdus nematophila str. Websteri]AYA40209.1 FAD-binding oxidoreductase [Xenorhabdus nematophila]KHD27816.1 FAD-dependent oxidoreductase [Xenorhabdus nematophila]MBA0018879.1 FAD-binding oxidoreductase [Xenorhabdus nematophila]MCB4426467.1 FAD-dependent oxidoreductase [Xenorhabdus nematophila]
MAMNRRGFISTAATLAGMGVLSSIFPTTSGLARTLIAADTPSVNIDQFRPVLLQDAKYRTSRLGLDPRIWNWHRDTAIKTMPANYYEASLADWPAFGHFARDQNCEVVVIGGGLLGASTALHLAEKGIDVILVEKDNMGSGASGRNGGQMTPGIARWSAETMLEKLSPDEAKRLWRLASVEAMYLVDELRERYSFECDRKYGHITAAIHPGHMGPLVADADARRHLGDKAVKVIGPQELQEEYVRSSIYHGANIDSIGGQVQPLALLRGLIYGFARLGGRVYDGTKVKGIRQDTGSAVIETKRGVIRASKAVVLGVHSSTKDFISGPSTTVPFFTYVAVTPPLPVDIKTLIPSDLPIYDTQLQIDYYRAVRDNRLLFGGQGTGNSWSPRDVNNYLLDRIRTVFPSLEKPELEYSWSGISDLTLNGATDARKSSDSVPVYMVHGWSGHGVAQTVRIGKAISDDLIGHNHDFTMLTRIEHLSIPLGSYFSPMVIPLIKGALGAVSTFNPANMVSF